MEMPPSINLAASDSEEKRQEALYSITLEIEMPPPVFTNSGREECLDSIVKPFEFNFIGQERNGEERCSVIFRYLMQTSTEPNSPERAELENKIVNTLAHLRGCCSATFNLSES